MTAKRITSAPNSVRRRTKVAPAIQSTAEVVEDGLEPESIEDIEAQIADILSGKNAAALLEPSPKNAAPRFLPDPDPRIVDPGYIAEGEAIHAAILAEPDELNSLAAEINSLYAQASEAHATVKKAASAELSLTRELGGRLLKAKELAGHGNWEAWVSTALSPELNKGIRQLQDYMRLAKHWDWLVERTGGEPGRLSLREAVTAIKKRLAARHQTQQAEQFSLPEQPAVPMPEPNDLIALYAQLGDIRLSRDGTGFSCDRPDLGAPFPLAFPSFGVAWAYWQCYGEKLLGINERKPRISFRQSLPEVGATVGTGVVVAVQAELEECTVNAPVDGGYTSTRMSFQEAVAQIPGLAESIELPPIEVVPEPDKQSDLKFLKEIRFRVFDGLDRRDPTQTEYALKMLDDWIQELQLGGGSNDK